MGTSTRARQSRIKVLMENAGGARRQRLVLVTAPFHGHLTPMLQLAQILYSKGFWITVAYLPHNAPDPSSHPDFQFLEIPIDVMGSKNSTCVAAIFQHLMTLNQECEPIFLSCLRDELMRQTEVHCVIYDEAMYFAAAAAHHLSLPSIILRTSSAAAHSSRVSLIQLHSVGCIPFPASSSEDLVPGNPALRLKDLPFTKATLESYLKLVIETTKARNSLAIIVNTTSCIEEVLLEKLRQESQIPTFAIGPMHKFGTISSAGILKEEDSTCIEWLNKQPRNSVLYVSMGSVVDTNEREVTEMAWGLANSDTTFLWVIRPGSVGGSQWIESLPKGFEEATRGRGHITKWAPQREVLAHEAVGGFWTHCGWNSTMESICEGVPMICTPNFGDQKVNARYVSHIWKVGLQLTDKGNRAEIETSIRKLMLSSEGAEIRDKATNLKKNMELCMLEGGSSYKSLNSLVEMLQDIPSQKKLQGLTNT